MSTTYYRQPDELTCIGCGKKDIKEAFPPSRKYADGTPKYKSRCYACCAAQRHNRIDRINEDRLRTIIAPRRAAMKLIERNPEALAELARRFYTEYALILEEERTSLLNTRREYVNNIRARRKKQLANELD